MPGVLSCLPDVLKTFLVLFCQRIFMKKSLLKYLFSFFMLLLPALTLFAQPANYWSISFNSEATLLGGAVVGGGSGITSIYYNPAGISEIKNSNIALNTSMFTLSIESYSNAFGVDEGFTHYRFNVLPRFFSYLYRSKRIPKLSWQFALFSHDYRKVNFYSTVTRKSDESTGMANFDYLGSFNMEGIFDDYWGGVGAAYELNDHFRVGFSIFLSYKSMLNYNRANTALYTDNELMPISGWSSFEWLNLWDLRALSKIGLRYEVGDMSIGMTMTMPSIRLFGYSYTKRELSQYNIVTDDGKPVPDYLMQESTEYIYSQVKDPFSISVGLRRQPVGSKSVYYFSSEFFARIKPYRFIDATRGGSVLSDPILGSEFSVVYYGNRPVINVALGYMLEMRENFELMFGFKSDFNSYYLPNSFVESHSNAMQIERITADFFHLTGGANFIFRKKLKINAGLSLSYGRSTNNKQFINFTDVKWYIPGVNLALQGERQNNMTYSSINLGLIVGFSYDF